MGEGEHSPAVSLAECCVCEEGTPGALFTADLIVTGENLRPERPDAPAGFPLITPGAQMLK